ncbi:LuxR C-terminal-related transcriptional regulator [Streptomyces sp. CL12-4]|uniref:LuxR C-terminal-related transcriptional regulator n=1 Tax=Streptomyces sp. CL12-4 TaxID=2810306 RepID=UPI001FDC768B|nr:LuxR C-terminal-related transcriptional regulator [Streptomyces sp. CL12-4]MCG8965232.1 AAA family ATPase [Streptomyces sp. CL12-4]
MTRVIDTPPTATGSAGPVPSPVLRGQRAERGQVLEAVRRLVHRHEGGVLWVEGPADAGKSGLLAFAAQETSLAGAGVLTGSGAVAGDAADGIPPLARLLDTPEPARGAPAGAHRAAHRTLRRIEDGLRELTRDRPLAVVLDDVHRCDDASLSAVHTLTARLTGAPLLWVLAARSHPDVPAVESLRRDLLTGPAARLELGALDPESVRLLIRDLLGPRAEQADPYLDLLGGLPGAVRHLCALLAGETVPGDPTRPGGHPVAGAVVTRRLDQLTREAEELVVTASAMGDSLGVRHLSRLLGRRESALLRPLREVLATGLIRVEGERLAFPHPSVRDAVVATLPRPVTLSVRRRSVDLLLAEGTPPAAVAAELGEIAEAGDEPAIRVLEAAARELAPVSPASAAAHLRRALELSGRAEPRRTRLAARLVPLLWETGEADAARALAREVVQAPPDPATHARVCLALTRMGGRFPVARAEAHLRRALSSRDVPLSLKDQLLSTTMLNRLLEGEGEEAGGGVPGAAPRARGTHPLSELTERTLRSVRVGHRHRWTEALRYSESVPAKATELDAAYGPAVPEVVLSMAWRAAVLGLTGDSRAAADLVEDGLTEAQQRGRQAFLPLWRTARARLALDGGRLPEAVAELTAAGAGPHPSGASTAGEAALVCTRARVAFHTGDDTELESCAARAAEYLAGDDPRLREAGAWTVLLLSVYRGKALPRHQQRLAAAHLRRGFLHTTCVDAGDVVLLTRAALGPGPGGIAATTVEFAEERARINPGLPLFVAAAAHARGLLEGNADLLAEAADQYADARPLLRARALEDAGEAAARAGVPGALPRFEEALALYATCGAERDGQRIRGRLRKLGIRGPASAGAAPDAGWRGLTRSEFGVVRLVALGATNREAAQRLFLSPHTVDTHLRHAFEKVGVRSRVQLARLYAREVESAKLPA